MEIKVANRLNENCYKDAESVRKFLELFASHYGMPLPGGLAKSSKTGMMLPVHYNYKKIWELYKSGSQNS